MRSDPVVMQHRSLLQWGVKWPIAFGKAVAFWASIAFPAFYAFGYLAAVLHPDLALPPAPVIGGVLAVNVLAVVVGQYHGDGAGEHASDSCPGASGE